MAASNKTLLIVDDDTTFSSILGRAFERRGFKVITADCSDQALQQCRLHRPDYGIVDLKLADESGLMLVPQLKALQPNIRILILTGYSSIATAVEAIKLGAVNYLCKPASSDEILVALGNDDANPDAPVATTPPSTNRLAWEHIQKVLAEHDGNISATARALGMHRRTLQRKLQKKPSRH